MNQEFPILVSIHSECMTGYTLFCLRCDRGPQLEVTMVTLASEGRGILLYLSQEGRGIGLFDKIKAYQLQEMGFDTVEGNRLLGLADDLCVYTLCKPMLEHFNIRSIKLLTNNPNKVKGLEELEFQVARVDHTTHPNLFNERYLETKASKMGHIFSDIES